MNKLILESIWMTLLFYLVLSCYCIAIVFYGFSYYFGAWDSTIKRGKLNRYYNEIGIDDKGKKAIIKLSDFLNTYSSCSESDKLEKALTLKQYSLGFVLFGFSFFVVLIALLLGGNRKVIYLLPILLFIIFLVIWFFKRKLQDGK